MLKFTLIDPSGSHKNYKIMKSINLLTLGLFMAVLLMPSFAKAQCPNNFFGGFDEYEVEDVTLHQDRQPFAAYVNGSAAGFGPTDLPILGFYANDAYVLAPDGSIDEYEMSNGHLTDENSPWITFSGGSADGISLANAFANDMIKV